MNKKLNLEPIGTVINNKGQFGLNIFKPYNTGLKELNHFSHVLVFWWASRCDNETDRSKTLTSLPYANNKEAGVFACRSEYRPNPIAITMCPIIKLDENKGIVDLAFIDADNETPVLDLKPYIPVSDRIKSVKVAEWFKDWPEWYEDAGSFFSQFRFE